MSAVAGRGLFRGLGYADLAEHGVSFCLAELRCDAIGQPLVISYSLNQLHDLKVREGGEVEIALRVDRVRVFADQAVSA